MATVSAAAALEAGTRCPLPDRFTFRGTPTQPANTADAFGEELAPCRSRERTARHPVRRAPRRRPAGNPGSRPFAGHGQRRRGCRRARHPERTPRRNIRPKRTREARGARREDDLAAGRPEVLRRMVATDASDEVASRRRTPGGMFSWAGSWARCRAASTPRPNPPVVRGWRAKSSGIRCSPPGKACRASCARRRPCSREDRESGRVRVLAFGDFGEHGNKRRKKSPMRWADTMRTTASILASRSVTTSIRPESRHPRRPMAGGVRRLYGPMRMPFYPSLGNHDWVLADSPAAEVLHSAQSEVAGACRRSAIPS